MGDKEQLENRSEPIPKMFNYFEVFALFTVGRVSMKARIGS